MRRKASDLCSALEKLPEIVPPGATPALFIDYDGTLTPIVSRPELARLDEATRRLLGELARRIPVAIISGRGLEDVRALVGLESLAYAGSHGYEIEGPAGSGLSHREGLAFASDLEQAEGELKRALASIGGALVERKCASVAAHYRLVADAQVAQVERAVSDLLARHPRLRAGRGKCVIELRPAHDWHKGKALLWLLERLDGRVPLLPIYVGDDVTDEDGFRALAARGIGIIVSDDARDTAARYRLRDPREVHVFLEQLLATAQQLATAQPAEQQGRELGILFFLKRVTPADQ